MPRSASPRMRLLDARGGVSWVTLVLLAALAGGAYLAWVWIPVFVLDYEVKQVVHEYMYKAVREHDDDRLSKDLLYKLRVVYEVEAPDENGRLHKVPGIHVDEDGLVWERDTTQDPPMLHVAFDYTIDVKYPFLDRVVPRTATIDLTQDLSVPDWGPTS